MAQFSGFAMAWAEDGIFTGTMSGRNWAGSDQVSLPPSLDNTHTHGGTIRAEVLDETRPVHGLPIASASSPVARILHIPRPSADTVMFRFIVAGRAGYLYAAAILGARRPQGIGCRHALQASCGCWVDRVEGMGPRRKTDHANASEAEGLA